MATPSPLLRRSGLTTADRSERRLWHERRSSIWMDYYPLPRQGEATGRGADGLHQRAPRRWAVEWCARQRLGQTTSPDSYRWSQPEKTVAMGSGWLTPGSRPAGHCWLCSMMMNDWEPSDGWIMPSYHGLAHPTMAGLPSIAATVVDCMLDRLPYGGFRSQPTWSWSVACCYWDIGPAVVS